MKEEEEYHETRIIGLWSFVGGIDPTGRGCAHPEDVWMTSQQLVTGHPVRQTLTLTLLIIHAGTNDVMNTRSEELLEKYRKRIRLYKCKTNKIIRSGLLPRSSAPTAFFNRVFSTNNRLKSICTDERIDFINCWDDFYNKPFLFKDDGLHLNPVRAARLGRLLNDKVSDFRRKNSIQPRTISAT